MSDLYWYQDVGIDWLIEHKGIGILFFPPSAGKTRVACDYLSLLARAKNDTVKVLVVCPLSALLTWVKQTEKYITKVALDVQVIRDPVAARWARLADEVLEPFDGPRVVIRVLGYSSFSAASVRPKGKSPEQVRQAAADTRKLRDAVVRTVRRWNGDVLIADEVHRAKSPAGQGSRLLRRAAPGVPRRIGLTGTFMPQGYEDLYGQLTAIAGPDVFVPYTGRPSWTAFKERYMKIDPWTHQITGYQNTDELDALVKQYVLSVSDDEVRGSRPPVTLTRVPFDLSHREHSRYEQLRKELALEIGDATSVPPSAMTLSLRLRQLTSGFLGMDDGSVVQTGTSRIDAAYDLVTGTLGEMPRVLVFGEWLHDVRSMADRLGRDRRTEVCLVTGATPVAEREVMLARFDDLEAHPGRMIMVAQVSTLGESVNELDRARHGVMLSPMWDRGKWVQAIGRLGRGSHPDPVTWWCMEADGTLDGRVYRALDEKGSLEGIVADECRAVPLHTSP